MKIGTFSSMSCQNFRVIGDSCTFQKHKTSHQFYRWQIKTTLCNLFPKDCLLETHLKIETTHHSSKLLNIIQSISQPQANLHANLHAIDARRFLHGKRLKGVSNFTWQSWQSWDVLGVNVTSQQLAWTSEHIWLEREICFLKLSHS